ncbi:MAG: hypothetical protein ABIN67_09160 [Ferruginibacter sp.]
MEYLFSKDALKGLIDNSPDSNTIVISVDYRFGPTAGEFLADITATARNIADASATKGATAAADGGGSVPGCPSPPGCR